MLSVESWKKKTFSSAYSRPLFPDHNDLPGQRSQGFFQGFFVEIWGFRRFLSNLWVSGHNVKTLYRFGAIVSNMKLFENNTSAKIPFKEDFWQICLQIIPIIATGLTPLYHLFGSCHKIIAAASRVRIGETQQWLVEVSQRKTLITRWWPAWCRPIKGDMISGFLR